MRTVAKAKLEEVSPVRVLIVDDDEEDFFITSEYIRNIEGRRFAIDWCYRYSNALKCIIERSHDIYFIDYYLGAKTGLDLMKEALQKQCEQPLILLTGMGNLNIDMDAMQAGAFDYLVKAELNTEKLERCIRYALDRAAVLKTLKTNEKKFRTIFEQSRDALFLMDEKLFFKDVNHISSELLGCDKNELLQLSLYDFLDDKRDALLIKEQLLLHGNVANKEINLISGRAEKKCCIISVSIVKDEEDNLYIQGIIHDITDLKNEEKATLQAEKLAASNRLIRTLAHEVRNPLNNINLSIDQLSQETNMESSQSYMDIIRRNSKRINDLITQLLDTSYYQEKNTFEKKLLQEIMDESLATIMDRIMLKKVNWKVIYPEEPAYILADAPKLKIAFTNIIINAIEAMKEESGELNISIVRRNGQYLVSIRDNGCGISSENLSHLFEPYFTFKRNGLGLGLATTLNIIQSHRGVIDVQTNENTGSNFILKFETAPN
jgi:PAS domain S-box-containing protein